jgi:EXS family
VAWIVIGSVSTLISFYWDIVQDWGLLVIGNTWKETRFLGRKLYFGSKNFYIYAIISNFILRVVWALNISLGLTDIIDNLIGVSGMFKFIVYLLELYRRC